MDKIIAIAGPTAVGKTALSFYLADHYRTELISGDAYQIYKGMDIGTAKILTAEIVPVPSSSHRYCRTGRTLFGGPFL